MKNNIKKAPVKFQEDLLYFQHFMLIFVFVPNVVIITTLNHLCYSCFWLYKTNSIDPDEVAH